MTHRLLVWFWFCTLGVSMAVAQEKPIADTPATPEDIKTMFTVMHTREQFQSTMDLMMAQMKQVTRDNLKKRMPNISPRELDRLDANSNEIMKSFPFDQMLDSIVPVYARHLSKTDVKAMIAFYSSPTGQKLMREQPAMAAETIEALRGLMDKVMEDAMDRAEKMANEDMHQKDAEAPLTPPR